MALIGRPLQEIIGGLEREVLDVLVEVSFRRRCYRGIAHRDTQRLRVVGLRDTDTGDYHLYITNIPPESLAAEDVRTVYAARWSVELLFRELKSEYRIDDLPSTRKPVVEALVYAAILTLLVSRRLLEALRSKSRALAERIPEQRWAKIFVSVAHDLLLLMTRPPRETHLISHLVCALLFHESVDPNRNRPPLIRAIELRRHAYRRKLA